MRLHAQRVSPIVDGMIVVSETRVIESPTEPHSTGRNGQSECSARDHYGAGHLTLKGSRRLSDPFCNGDLQW